MSSTQAHEAYAFAPAQTAEGQMFMIVQECRPAYCSFSSTAFCCPIYALHPADWQVPVFPPGEEGHRGRSAARAARAMC